MCTEVSGGNGILSYSVNYLVSSYSKLSPKDIVTRQQEHYG